MGRRSLTMPVRVDRGGLGRGACLALVPIMLLLFAPSASRAAGLPVVDQVQGGLTKTVQDIVAAAPGQASTTLHQAPAAVRRVVATPPVGDVARPVPRSVQGLAEGVRTTVRGTVSQVTGGDVTTTAQHAVSQATSPARAGAVVHRVAGPSASAEPHPAPRGGARGDGGRHAAHARPAFGQRVDALAAHAAMSHTAAGSAASPLVAWPADRTARSSNGEGPARAAAAGERSSAPPSELPHGPSSAAGAAASALFSPTGLAVLVAALGLGASRWSRRLAAAGPGWCPTHVAGVLERPG